MFTALLLLLVVGMGGVVLTFAQRNLRFEPYRRRFTVLGALLVVAGAVLVLTPNLVALAVAWVATSVLARALIETGPGATGRAHRARRAFAVGDLCILASVALLVASTGSTSISTIDQAGPVVLSLAGVLLVVAAAARCASGPFVRWLPDSLSAPTPSSALLHAGVVNGGAIVLIRLAPATSGTVAAAVTAVAIGAVTCAVGLAVERTRPDVKGRLAWSTIAQMSFTLVLCGFGLHIAAALHLVAHGFYKGTRFLGSGGVVRTVVRKRRAPAAAAATSRLAPVAAFGLAGLAVIGVVQASGTHVHADLVVAAGLAWFAAGSAMHRSLGRPPALSGRAAVALGGVALLAGYLALTVQLEQAVGRQLSLADHAISAWWLVPVLLAVCVGTSLLGDGPAWVRALGRPSATRSPSVARPVAARPIPAAVPAARPQPHSQPQPEAPSYAHLGG